MSTSSERTELLERERRWMRPAGIAAILGLVAFLAGGAIQGSALEGDGLAEELLFISEGDADGQLPALGDRHRARLAACSLRCWSSCSTAAAARSDRMRRQLLPLIVVGSVLLAAAQVASHFALLNAADDFAAAEAERAQPAPEETAESTKPAAAGEKTGERGEAGRAEDGSGRRGGLRGR